MPPRRPAPPRIHVSVGAGTREFLLRADDHPGLRERRIELAGLSLARPGFSFARTEMGREQILVCFRGEGEVMVNREWKRCGPGLAYATPPYGFHAYRATGPWEVGWIIFARHHPRTPGLDAARLQEANPRPLEAALRGMYEEASTAREASALQHWGELLHRYGRRILVPAPEARLWPLWQAVEARIDRPWTLADLCRASGFGAESLRLFCLAETGTSPVRHVSRLRMRHAAALLRLGYKVEAAAKAVGYRNGFAFSTAFRRTMGAPPSAFQGERTGGRPRG